MLRVYRYRLRPTRAQDAALRETLERLRELYNAALQHRATHTGSRALRSLRTPDARACRRPGRSARVRRDPHPPAQDALTRLDRAYRAFFRRIKAGETTGFPRFKGRDATAPSRSRTPSIVTATDSRWRQARQARRHRQRQVRLHREIQGRIKQASVSLDGDGHWYVAFACDDVPARPLPATGRSVGIDVGITTFAALSDGTMVENPRPTRLRSEPSPRRSGALLGASAGRVVGTRRRSARLQACRVQRVRSTSTTRPAQYRSALRFDRSGGPQRQRLGAHAPRQASTRRRVGSVHHDPREQAERAGREFFRVDPRALPKMQRCHERVPKGLHVRIHACPHCGLVEDRDVNAAINVQRRGQRLRGG